MHILVYFLFIFICSNINHAETRCVERDRRALLEFKKVVVDDYAILKSWRNTSSSRDCCEWRGVGCSNDTGEVIKLDLHADVDEFGEFFGQLSGKIDSSLLLLTSLRFLDLTGNSFTHIPKFLGSLKTLQHLKLAYINSLTSSRFPYQLGNLSNIQTLDLMGTPVVMKNTDWLSGLSFLKYLNLSFIDLSESVGFLSNAIRLPSLVELQLEGCSLPNNTHANLFHLHSMTNFSDSFAVVNLNSNDLPNSMIYPWLFNFSNSLTDIDLSNNNLLGTIPEALGTFKNLRTLDLTNNGFEGGIPSSFGNLSDLQKLFLSLNNLNQDLPGLFNNLSEKSLQILDLFKNQLSGSLPDFTKFTALKELYIGVNRLNGSFPGKFGQKSNLSILDLADNRMNGLLPDLSVFTSLRVLYFERNHLNGTLAEKIEALLMLESLGASSNHFQGTISESHVSNLSRLTYLDLSFNSLALDIGSDWSAPFQLQTISLSSCKIRNSLFPKWLKTQKKFSVLDISNTGINDFVPSWFWESLNQTGIIRYLNLSSNQIQGMIPDFLSADQPIIDMSSNNLSGSLPLFPLDTYTLQLSGNMFSGPISSLCNLTSLSRLDLSNNKLSGELPNCWDNLEGLAVLNLEDNGFTGSVPDSIGALTWIDMMSLRGNSLTGKLPSSLKSCTGLRFLDLGENEFSGKIPEWLGKSFPLLIVLSLPSNQFHGPIPTSLCKLKNIQILDLSINNISGKIPKCFNHISRMTTRDKASQLTSLEFSDLGLIRELDRTRLYIIDRAVFKVLLQWKGREAEYKKTLRLVVSLDLSSNRLTGEIPVEITSLSALVALNLSRNNLTRSIPKHIGRLGQLEFLDLSRNNMVGGIPTSLAQLTNLGLLDLSFNNLSGRIPKGTQLQSFDVSSYAGNPALCGVPLPNVCPGDELESKTPDVVDVVEQESDDDDDKLINKGFLIGIVTGFAFGFWGLFGSLVLKQSWRHAYYGFLDVIKDWVLPRLDLGLARLQKKHPTKTSLQK